MNSITDLTDTNNNMQMYTSARYTIDLFTLIMKCQMNYTYLKYCMSNTDFICVLKKMYKCNFSQLLNQ